jgi:hypothetical protein
MAKTDPGLDQALSLLLSSRDRFEARAGKELYGAMLVTSDIRASSSWSPPGGEAPRAGAPDLQGGSPDAVAAEPGTGKRYPVPLPERLWFKRPLDRWETVDVVHDRDGVSTYCKVLLLCGNPDSLSEYRELCQTAAAALRQLSDVLGESAGAPRVRAAISDFAQGFAGGDDPQHPADAAMLWSLVVHSLLDVEDQGGGLLMER